MQMVACNFDERSRSFSKWVGGIWKRRFQSEKASNVSRLLRRNLKTQFEETRSGKSHGYRNAIVFEKLHFKNIFRTREKEKPALSNSPV